MSECGEQPEKYGQHILGDQNWYRHTVNKNNRDGERDIDENKKYEGKKAVSGSLSIQ